MYVTYMEATCDIKDKTAAIKYSGERDYAIGARGRNGMVRPNERDGGMFKGEEALKNGMSERKPL